jgi:uncharacterized membrane protein
MYETDKKWINEQLEKLPRELRKKITYKYNQAFNAAHNKEPIEHKKVEAGRFAANTKLRIYMNKINSVNN